MKSLNPVMLPALVTLTLIVGCSQTCDCVKLCEQHEGLDRMTAIRAHQPVTIDGKLDDPVWQHAPVYDMHRAAADQQENGPLAETGQVRLAWDKDFFYLAVKFFDSQIVAHGERDHVLHYEKGDLVELFLNPACSSHYWELYGTPRDKKTALFFTNRGAPLAPDETFADGMIVAADLHGTLNDPTDTDGGWTVEIAIPWTALKDIARDRACPPEPGEWWRMNLSRVQWEHRLEDGRYMRAPVVGRGWKGEDNWVWSPQGVVAMHQPETWGFVTFVGADGAVASDPREAMRAVYEILWPVYGAQVAYHEEHGRYATRLADLDDVDPVVPGLRLDATATTWTATFDGWTVAHDGRLTAP